MNEDKTLGIVKLNEAQLKKEQARSKAMRENLQRRKSYQKAIEALKNKLPSQDLSLAKE